MSGTRGARLEEGSIESEERENMNISDLIEFGPSPLEEVALGTIIGWVVITRRPLPLPLRMVGGAIAAVVIFRGARRLVHLHQGAAAISAFPLIPSCGSNCGCLEKK